MIIFARFLFGTLDKFELWKPARAYRGEGTVPNVGRSSVRRIHMVGRKDHNKSLSAPKHGVQMPQEHAIFDQMEEHIK